MTAAKQIDEPDKRATFLQRLGAELVVGRGIRRPTDAELELASQAALRGLLPGGGLTRWRWGRRS